MQQLNPTHPYAHIPAQVNVACGDAVGVLVLATGFVHCDGVDYTPTEFERLGGRGQTKKWKCVGLREVACACDDSTWTDLDAQQLHRGLLEDRQSIRLADSVVTLGEWLTAHGLDIKANLLSVVAGNPSSHVNNLVVTQEAGPMSKPQTTRFGIFLKVSFHHSPDNNCVTPRIDFVTEPLSSPRDREKALEELAAFLSGHSEHLPLGLLPGGLGVIHVNGQPLDIRDLYRQVRALGGYEAIHKGDVSGWAAVAASMQLSTLPEPDAGLLPDELLAHELRALYEQVLLRFERRALLRGDLGLSSSSPRAPLADSCISQGQRSQESSASMGGTEGVEGPQTLGSGAGQPSSSLMGSGSKSVWHTRCEGSADGTGTGGGRSVGRTRRGSRASNSGDDVVPAVASTQRPKRTSTGKAKAAVAAPAGPGAPAADGMGKRRRRGSEPGVPSPAPDMMHSLGPGSMQQPALPGLPGGPGQRLLGQPSSREMLDMELLAGLDMLVQQDIEDALEAAARQRVHKPGVVANALHRASQPLLQHHLEQQQRQQQQEQQLLRHQQLQQGHHHASYQQQQQQNYPEQQQYEPHYQQQEHDEAPN